MNDQSHPIAKLLWHSENGDQGLDLFKGEVITIGRGDGNTIILNSARISRNHARIEWSMDNFSVRDMNSSNGTYVNGQRIEHLPCALNDGDLIMLERIPIQFKVIKAAIPLFEQDASTLPTVPKIKQGVEVVRPRLVLNEEADFRQDISLSGEEITIGRECPSANWHVQLKDSAVSRPHARITLNQGQYSITDLGSANGTTVNNVPVYAPVILREGDLIEIGATKLTFHLKG
mgnify:CR=1 FL=1